jgi:hypothetical protein
MVEDICYRNAERYFGLEVGRFDTRPARAEKDAARKPARR